MECELDLRQINLSTLSFLEAKGKCKQTIKVAFVDFLKYLT